MYWGAGGPAWLGRRLYEAEAAGSNPARPTFYMVKFFPVGDGVVWGLFLALMCFSGLLCVLFSTV